jgi:hypothetical protein
MSVPEDTEPPDEGESMMEESPPGEQRKESNPMSDSKLVGSFAVQIVCLLLFPVCLSSFSVICDPLICLTFTPPEAANVWFSPKKTHARHAEVAHELQCGACSACFPLVLPLPLILTPVKKENHSLFHFKRTVVVRCAFLFKGAWKGLLRGVEHRKAFLHQMTLSHDQCVEQSRNSGCASGGGRLERSTYDVST